MLDDLADKFGPEITDAIKAAVIEEFPREAIGFVVQTPAGEQRVIRCRNTHEKPHKRFRYDDAEWDAAAAQGEIALTWHGHPNTKADPSDDDKTFAEGWEIPLLVYAHPADTWGYYEPCGWVAPLVGRVFSYDVLNCYRLLRDYFKQKHNIAVPDFHAPNGWWLHKRDANGRIVERAQEIYLDNLDAAGFVIVPDLREDDAIIMRVVEGAASHVGIYLGDGQMLHHYVGNRSGKTAYIPRVGFYGQATVAFARHKSLC